MTLRPDAQAFDEIRITTIPRYKTSELSGDEWRISAQVDFYRKGVMRHSTAFRDVETAAGFLYAEFHKATDNGLANFASEDDFCDQEGCSEKAVGRFKLRQEFCREGHGTPPGERAARQFCQRHIQRGDCGLEDADSNYIDKP